MAKRRSRSAPRRTPRSSYAPRRSTRRASPKRSYRSRAGGGRRGAAPRGGRLVIEVVQSGSVRAGEPVSVGQKVASAPRLKPRF